MHNKIYVKKEAPLLVRIYNVFLFICSKIRLIDYRIDKTTYLDQLSKEKTLGIGNNDIAVQALNKFIDNVNQNDLNPATQIFINNELQRTFLNRKKIHGFLNKTLDISNIDLSGPVFVLGLPRTGTTALQNLFSLLGNCRVLKLWELHYPTAYLEGQQAISAAKKETMKYSFLQNLSKPEQKYVHPVGANYPDECFRLLFNSFTSIAISSALGLDDYEKWILESDMLQTYEDYKTQLQVLSKSDPQKQMISKAPEHLWNLDVLLKVFPSARIVMTHRDPVRSIVSYASMISMFRRTAYKRPDFKQLGSYVTKVFERGMKKAILLREKTDLTGKIIDIHCDNIQELPLQSIIKVCAFFEIEISKEDKNQIKNWIKNKKLDAPGTHQYDYETYGVDKALIKEKFHFYNHKDYKEN